MTVYVDSSRLHAGRYQLSNKADASALKVINTSQATPAGLPDFVAYPYEDYPARYFNSGALFSFGVIANKSSAFGANASVNFSAATIEVRERGAGTLAGVTTIQRKAFKADAARLIEIAKERTACGFVLGLPINMDGSEGPRAQSTRAFARNFSQLTS